MFLKKHQQGFNTASGKYCCNNIYQYIRNLYHGVSIPQAVSTVATSMSDVLESALGVSIPQAVSTVATCWRWFWRSNGSSFNTASGKHCCNHQTYFYDSFSFLSFNTASGKYCCNKMNCSNGSIQLHTVSIPQAVSTVATAGPRKPVFIGLKIRF